MSDVDRLIRTVASGVVTRNEARAMMGLSLVETLKPYRSVVYPVSGDKYRRVDFLHKDDFMPDDEHKAKMLGVVTRIAIEDGVDPDSIRVREIMDLVMPDGSLISSSMLFAQMGWALHTEGTMSTISKSLHDGML
jgi:hypothetical protein